MALVTIMEWGSIDLTHQVFWGKARYFGIVTVPLAWMAFTLIYTGREKWLTRRNLSALAVIPMVTPVNCQDQ
ncbi:histidine kinase N-terminal 7TM domain-containing protein [Chloroflexota bacterium]